MRINRSAAFTLVEVVVGTVLMASLMCGSLIALSRFEEIRQRSLDRHNACLAADRLLDHWSSHSVRVPRRAFGMTHDGKFTWRTEITGVRILMNTPVSIVQLSLQRPDQLAKNSPPLVRLELPIKAGQ